MIPPEARVRKHARFVAQIKGVAIEVPKSVKLKLTGEKLICAIVGFPIMNCHQGTKTEIAINNKVEIPAINAIMLILFNDNLFSIKRTGSS